MMIKNLFTIALLIVLAPLAIGEESLSPQADPTISGKLNMTMASTLDAIGELEALSDPKCLATANRVENYLFGTPMTDEARYQKTDLQKTLIDWIWSKANIQKQIGADQITLEDLNSVLSPILEYQFVDNKLLIHHSSGETIEISKNQFDHYSSIAYSLRAILSFKQDLIMKGFDRYPPLTRDAENKLTEFLDVASVVVLYSTDIQAREHNVTTISAELYEKKWRHYFPFMNTEEDRKLRVVDEVRSGYQVMLSIVEKKIASYKTYNAIESLETLEGNSEKIFHSFVQKAYVQHPIPNISTQHWESMKEAYQNQWILFARELWTQSSITATKDRHDLVRMKHMNEVLKKDLPFHVNQYEDVTFSTTIPPIVLKAYDLDSFRDFAWHWKVIMKLLNQIEDDFLQIDPFAMEVFAEGVAQYGVLLMRVSGMIAEELNAPIVTSEHVKRAVERIQLWREKPMSELPKSLVKRADVISASRSSRAKNEPPFRMIQPNGFQFKHKTAKWLNQMREKGFNGFLDFSGGGVAVEDVNQDGYPDIFLVSGGGNALLLNDTQGGFRNETVAFGLDEKALSPGEPRQPLFADLDNDGDQDLFISYVREPNRIYRNHENRYFEDMTDRVDLGGLHHVAGPATIFDYNRDGLLDIYIGYFGDYVKRDSPKLSRNNLNASKNQLFENQGQFQFTNVTRKSKSGHRGWAQAIIHSDINQDGWQDIIIANDFGKNVFLLNQKNGKFTDVAKDYQLDDFGHSMNVGVTDINRDGYPDYFISNIGVLVKDNKYTLPYEDTDIQFDPEAMANIHIMESNFFHVSMENSEGLSYSLSQSIHRGAIYSGWAWDADFFDYDLDGDDDLYLVNGATKFTKETKSDGLDLQIYPVNYGENRNVLYENRDGKLQNVTKGSGAGQMSTARSAAYLDFDLDGDLDIVVNNYESDATFIENRADTNDYHWAKIKLIGNPSKGSSRDAVGAKLIATTKKGAVIWREVRTATGYLSMHSKIQHLGLGDAQEFDLQIVWPNGDRQDLHRLKSNQLHQIQQI